MNFKDYFSGHATDYATYRPHYPPALFAWLAEQCEQRDRAWDCATGNGQAAIALTHHFRQIIATDASLAQIEQAPAHPQVTYQVDLAEHSGLPNQSLDLVTVAQAIHWFDLTAFVQEVERVLKPGGLLAIWCYGRPRLANVSLERHLEHYYNHTLDNFWTPERRLVEDGYRNLPIPFPELETPAYTLQVVWTLPELMGYLFTWSATQRFILTHGHNPLETLAEQMQADWQGDRCQGSAHLSLRVFKMDLGDHF